MYRYSRSWFEVGDYIKQELRDMTTWALVIGKLKNGAEKVIAVDSDRGIPAIRSTSGWYPSPVRIDESEIPEKFLKKILKKKNQVGASKQAKDVTFPEMWNKVKKVYDQTQKQIEMLPWLGDVELMAAGRDEYYTEDVKEIYDEMIKYEEILEDFLARYKGYRPAHKQSSALRKIAQDIVVKEGLFFGPKFKEKGINQVAGVYKKDLKNFIEKEIPKKYHLPDLAANVSIDITPHPEFLMFTVNAEVWDEVGNNKISDITIKAEGEIDISGKGELDISMVGAYRHETIDTKTKKEEFSFVPGKDATDAALKALVKKIKNVLTWEGEGLFAMFD